MSAGPPGPNGTTMRTGLAGHDCAPAGAARAATAAIARTNLIGQRMASSRNYCWSSDATATANRLELSSNEGRKGDGGNRRRAPQRREPRLLAHGLDDAWPVV